MHSRLWPLLGAGRPTCTRKSSSSSLQSRFGFVHGNCQPQQSTAFTRPLIRTLPSTYLCVQLPIEPTEPLERNQARGHAPYDPRKFLSCLPSDPGTFLTSQSSSVQFQVEHQTAGLAQSRTTKDVDARWISQSTLSAGTSQDCHIKFEQV